MNHLDNFVVVEKTRSAVEDCHKNPKVEPKKLRVHFSGNNADMKTDVCYSNGPNNEPDNAAPGEIMEQECYLEGPKRPKVQGVLYTPPKYYHCGHGREFVNSTLKCRVQDGDVEHKRPEQMSKNGEKSKKHNNQENCGQAKRFMNAPQKNDKRNHSATAQRNDFPKNPLRTLKKQEGALGQKEKFAFGEHTERRQAVENQINAPQPKLHHGEIESEIKIKVSEQKFSYENEKLVRQLQQEVKHLRMEKEEREKTVNILQGEVEKSNSIQKNQVSETLKKQEKIDQLQEDLKSAHHSLKEQDAKHRAHNEDLKRQVFEMKAKLRKAEEQQAKAELTSQNLEQKLQREKESCTTLREQRTRDSGNYQRELQTALQNVRKQDAKHKEDRRLLQCENRELKTKLKKSEELKAKTELSVHSLKEELQKQKELNTKFMAQRSREMGNLQQELQTKLQTLEEQDTKLKEDKKALQSEINELKAKLSKSEELKATAELSARSLKRELQRSRESVAELQKKQKTKKCKKGKTVPKEKEEKVEQLHGAEEENTLVQEKRKELENVTSNQPLQMEEKVKTPTVKKSKKKKTKRVI